MEKKRKKKKSLRELHDLFYAGHFLRLIYIAYNPLVFLLQKRVFKERFILSKGCQGFNKGCCQYNLIKREMTGLFVCSRKMYDSKR